MGVDGTFSRPVKNLIASSLNLLPKSARTKTKYLIETAFWKKVLKNSNQEFYNGHMVRAFTDVFQLDKSFYDGKKILDIGCGPIGTLEWADNAEERVGADPLAESYLKMTEGKQQMRYVCAPAEQLPFEDGHFDVVSIFNALDHVDDVDKAIAEACRVVAPGGTLLLIVELNHKPTVTEPHSIDTSILDKFGFEVTFKGTYAIRDDHNVYGSLFDAMPQKDPNEPAVMCVRMVA